MRELICGLIMGGAVGLCIGVTGGVWLYAWMRKNRRRFNASR